MTFQEIGIQDDVLKAITEMGYEQPMPVQEAVIPLLLAERTDIVALAQTGTGKTAAFGLPLIQRVDLSHRQPQALVLAPTRELCLQITSDLQDYSKYVNGLKILPVYGGSSIDSQIRSLKAGVHIIVATPGRLLDLMSRKTVKLGLVNTVVMDEADEMLNMGFTDSINSILAEVPEERNTLLFSATMPPEISRISKKYMRNPKEVTIGNKNEGSINIKHLSFSVHAKDKYATLKRLVDYYPSIYGIVFCRTRRETQEIADQLIKDGYNADSLHGELSQAQRDFVMQKFRMRNLQLLIATDVAARGLDVTDLTHVINYGLPDDIETYTHRSGRTGRAGKSGTSIVIIHMKERGKLREIERIINKKFEIGKVPTAEKICEKRLFAFADQLEFVKVNEDEIAEYLPTIQRKLEWLSHEDLLKRALSLELNRLLDYYRDVAEIEVVSERTRDSKGKDEFDRDVENRRATKGFKRLFLNAGKMDGIYPNTLIDLLNRALGYRVEIGKIDLMKDFSYFEVPDRDASEVIEALSSMKQNGRKMQVEIAQENAAPREGGYKKFSSGPSSEKKRYGFDSRPKREGATGNSEKPWRKNRK